MTSVQQENKKTVKQVSSGDSIFVTEKPKGGPPKVEQIFLANVRAPKLAKRILAKNDPQTVQEETKDEPFAWEAREFLRKKLVGEEVVVVEVDKEKKLGVIRLGEENITETLVKEGLVRVRDGNSPELIALKRLEDEAKSAGKGLHGATGDQAHVRDVKWTIDNLQQFLDKNGKNPIPAIIEYVRDGSTVKAVLLPDFYHITLMITGIRCPPIKSDSTQQAEYAEEAKFFVEHRLLQRDVEIVLESVNNNIFVGSIRHPKGNIAEVLLREGFAQCVDWSMSTLKSGSDKLRAAEKYARENRIRRWKNWQPTTPQLTGKEKEFTGTVVEVVGGDALMIKVGNGPPRKIFLAHIRPPKDPAKLEENKSAETGPAAKTKASRQLYDIPWMFEAREFLRKKLIGKKVNVVVDYIQAAKENFPQKTCCTVTIGGVNVAEAMLSKGLGYVVRHAQDDDQRSSHYNDLLNAESKAKKSLKGVHAKKDIPQHRVIDVSADVNRAKQSNSLRRGRHEAVVEFVASGSRLRLYIPKNTCLITFLLAGIDCPRATRPNPGGVGTAKGDEYGDEALLFTKELCLQREVEISVESVDRRGNFIGWLWLGDVNLSVALVKDGLASVHSSAQNSDYFKDLTTAEESAKSRREKLWKNYVETKEKIEEEVVVDRQIDYQTVVVIEGTAELKFYAQNVDQGQELESLMNQMRQEFQSNPPLAGAYAPKRAGEICAAKYTDDQWYRARVEKVSGSDIHIFYIDYGNREVISAGRCASLPSNFASVRPFAIEYNLAFVKLPSDTEDKIEAVTAFKEDIENREFLLNIEYRIDKAAFASLTCSSKKSDVGKLLVRDGLLLVDTSRKARHPKVFKEYEEAQNEAKKERRCIWRYGDITEDDAKEFGR